MKKKANGDTRITKLTKPDRDLGIKAKTGYCIQCGSIVPFNLSKPYCPNCLKETKEGIDNEFGKIEKYCHYCLHAGIRYTTGRNPATN
jgi:hypothetical protein